MKIGPFTPPDVREAITLENETVFSIPSELVPAFDIVIAGIRFRLKEHEGIRPFGIHLRQISPFLSNQEKEPDFEISLRRDMSPYMVQEPITGNMFIRMDSEMWTFSSTAWCISWNVKHPRQLKCDYYCSIMHAVNSLRLFLAHYLLLSKSGILLHASAAIYNDKTYVFLGRSGAGKSNSVYHSPGQLLADESVIIKLSGTSNFTVHGTPFGGEHFPNALPGLNPHLLFVEKSNRNFIKPLLLRNAVARLLSQVTISPSAPPFYWDRATEMLERIIELLKIEVIEAKKDGSFWEECL